MAKQDLPVLDEHDTNGQISVRNEWWDYTDYIMLKWSNLSELAILVDAGLWDSPCR